MSVEIIWRNLSSGAIVPTQTKTVPSLVILQHNNIRVFLWPDDLVALEAAVAQARALLEAKPSHA